jgi:hypothetical protein
MQLGGIGQLRDPLRVDEGGHLDGLQSRVRSRRTNSALTSTGTDRRLVLQAVAHPHFVDAHPLRAGWDPARPGARASSPSDPHTPGGNAGRPPGVRWGVGPGVPTPTRTKDTMSDDATQPGQEQPLDAAGTAGGPDVASIPTGPPHRPTPPSRWTQSTRRPRPCPPGWRPTRRPPRWSPHPWSPPRRCGARTAGEGGQPTRMARLSEQPAAAPPVPPAGDLRDATQRHTGRRGPIPHHGSGPHGTTTGSTERAGAVCRPAGPVRATDRRPTPRARWCARWASWGS